MASHHDWHPADIIAALRKKGTTLAALSRSVGLSSSTLANVLSRPWPKGEWIVATALDVHPAEIWPSRYFDSSGTLLDRKKRIRKKLNEEGKQPAI
ncbi:helix-turn-helix domain-containing protein [Lonsdalea quercina]|uniref:helix-turn-helix domain-containing protein n=1 Tax=Lonsdalea quercina TaxID=71657 RepID=UPI0037613FD2